MAEVYWIHLPEHTDMFSEGYVGFTSKTAHARFSQHKSSAYKRYKNIPLLNAILKYKEALVVDVVCICGDAYGLFLEKAIRPAPKIGWNIAVGGEAPSRGRPTSDETKMKQSIAHRGKKQSKEQVAKLIARNTGRVVSQQTRDRMSCAMKLRPPPSQELRDKISTACKGRLVTDETRQKMSEATGLWKSKCSNKDTWLLAEEIHTRWINRLPRKFLESVTEILPSATAASLHKLKMAFTKGWIPSEDTDFILWREIHKQKEKGDNGT